MTQKTQFKKLEDFGYGPNVMKKTKVCPKCGKTVNVKFRNCTDCGEQLSSETLFDRYKRQHPCCPECDTVFAPDSLYCPNCGKQILRKAAGNEKGGG